MPRAKRGFKRRQRMNKFKDLAQGFWGRRKSNPRTMIEAVDRAHSFAFRDRRVKKRDFRMLWIERLSAALGQHDVSYSKFVAMTKKANIGLNRKMLSEIAIADPSAFTAIVGAAKSA